MTNSTPSAWSSAPRVMMPWAESRPPTPGVSIRQSPARKNSAGQPDLDRPEPRRLPGLPGLGHPVGDRSRSAPARSAAHRPSLGPSKYAVALGGFAESDEGGDDRDLVGVDRADGRLQQRVDQGALASLEFADDGHRDRAVVEPGPGTVQRDGQIGAVLGNGQFPALVQPRHRLLDQALLTREFVGVGATGIIRRVGWPLCRGRTAGDGRLRGGSDRGWCLSRRCCVG